MFLPLRRKVQPWINKLPAKPLSMAQYPGQGIYRQTAPGKKIWIVADCIKENKSAASNCQAQRAEDWLKLPSK